MNKQYQAPKTIIVKVGIHQMLCGSITSNGESLSVGLDGATGDFDNNTINVKGNGDSYNVWNDDWSK